MALRLALITSALVLAGRALVWSMLEIVTIFGIGPIVLTLVTLFGISVVVAAVHLARHAKNEGIRAGAPLAIHASAIVLLLIVPFDSLAIEADYVLHRNQRSQAVALYREHRLEAVRGGPNNAVLKLPDKLASASRGGGEIIACGEGPNASLLFFTYRGVLERYSGFLYRPDGTPPPDDCEDGQFRQVLRKDEAWFFVAN